MTRMRGIFITGTDTGIGKTTVTAALLSRLRRRGHDAVPMKPVQTGCLHGPHGLVASDTEFCLSMAALAPSPDEAALMTPYCFEPACSPHLAAERAASHIDLSRIVKDFETLATLHEAVLVEGAGGLLVPLSDEAMMSDLMARLDLPVLLVAKPGLGTLNHTLLSVEAMRNRELQVCAIVTVSCEPDRDLLVQEDNAQTLARLTELPVLGPVPFMSAVAEGTIDPREFEALTGHIADAALSSAGF